MCLALPPVVNVWDPLVRIGHWVLVIAFAVAYFTEDELLDVHVWAGYVVAAYIAVRVVWGFVGPQHARFADFAYSPIKGASYLVDLFRKRAKRHLGHSPAGAMMVFALLLALTGTVVTGMAELALSRGEGPLSLVIERRAEAAPTNEAEGKGEESDLLEVHELLANLTLILIGFHIAGVILASWAHKESLVLAMINGTKRASAQPEPKGEASGAT